MKRFAIILFVAMAVQTAIAEIKDYSVFDNKFNFYVVNDMGRNGYYYQKPIAEMMGRMAEEIGPEFVLANGDVHHFEGVISVLDPLWLTNYEHIYSHPELMIPWYPTLGNHEYRGSTKAVLDYATLSRRWMMPARYYTKTFEAAGSTLRILWIDTCPMIDKYRIESDVYPDGWKQDYNRQLAWIDSVLTVAKEDWIIVAGHHPIYAETGKDSTERLDMQARLDPILRKHNIDLYINGHIHNFQHVQTKDSNIDYVTNSAAALARKVKRIDGTVFCSPEEGFSVISIDSKTLELRMIDKNGDVIYTLKRKKQKRNK